MDEMTRQDLLKKYLAVTADLHSKKHTNSASTTPLLLLPLLLLLLQLPLLPLPLPLPLPPLPLPQLQLQVQAVSPKHLLLCLTICTAPIEDMIETLQNQIPTPNPVPTPILMLMLMLMPMLMLIRLHQNITAICWGVKEEIKTEIGIEIVDQIRRVIASGQ